MSDRVPLGKRTHLARSKRHYLGMQMSPHNAFFAPLDCCCCIFMALRQVIHSGWRRAGAILHVRAELVPPSKRGLGARATLHLGALLSLPSARGRRDAPRFAYLPGAPVQTSKRGCISRNSGAPRHLGPQTLPLITQRPPSPRRLSVFSFQQPHNTST